jgi:outer membrane protein assembly factor BamE (lipoprotein component of BamABCDE complex)
MKKVIKLSVLTAVMVIFSSGCAMNQNYYDPQADEKLTLGKAQREIKVGMSTAEVVQVMGSPNIVSTDEKRREVWVYDKISTQVAYSKSSAGIGGLVFGVVGGAIGSASGEGGSSARTQRTLTVIIKFDENSKVRDLSYHSTSF